MRTPTQMNNTTQKRKKSSSPSDTSSEKNFSQISPVIPGDELGAAPYVHNYKVLKSQMTDNPFETDNGIMFEAKKIFGLRDKYFKKIDGRRNKKSWLGGGSDRKGWDEQARLNYGNCGVNGVREVSKDGETRDKVYYCNHKNYCPRCSVRYSNGIARKARAIVEGILRRKKSKESKLKTSLLTPTFTLPKKISEGIMDREKGERKDILSELHRGVAETLRTVFVEKLDEDESLAIGTTVHTWKSEKPWKAHVHVHTMMPSVVLNKSTGKKRVLMDEGEDFRGEKRNKSKCKRGNVSRQILGRLRRVWTRVARDRLAEYFPGFDWPDEEEEEFLNYHWSSISYLPCKENREKTSKETKNKLRHKLEYNFRTHMQDLWKSVSKDELPDFLIPKFADINEKFRQSGERIRWYGYWSKGTRAKNLKGYFGMRLVDDEDDDFNKIDSFSFIVLHRTKKYMWVAFKDAARDEKLERADIRGEKNYSSGQMWNYPTGEDPG